MNRRNFAGLMSAGITALLSSCASRRVYYPTAPAAGKSSSNEAGAYRESRIMSSGRFNSRQLTAYFLTKNRHAKAASVDYIARVYIKESSSEGVNHDIAFVQMCHETSFLRYGNQVQHWQHNYCGLGATDNGARGLSFPDVQTGVRAHIQHLKAYASTYPLRNRLVDPRFKYVKRGSAPTIDQLAGTWASDRSYGDHLRKHLSAMVISRS